LLPIEQDGVVASECRLHIRIEPDGTGFGSASDRSLLATMERVRIGRGAVGGCGRCSIRAIEGTVLCGKMSRADVNPQQERQGYSLACGAYSRGDLVLSWAPSIRPGGAAQGAHCAASWVWKSRGYGLAS